MRIISWNVNGVRSCAKKGFLKALHTMNPDILGIQEVRAVENQIEAALRAPPGWTTYWNSGERGGYSGVGVYTKTTPHSVNRDLGQAEFDAEGRLLEMDYGDFILMNVYFPNGSGSDRTNSRVPFKLAFYDCLLKRCVRYMKAGRHLVVMGDYNTAHEAIDLKNAKANERTSGFLPEERVWIGHYLKAGFVDTFRHFHPGLEGAYSWWTFRANARARNIGWRIDYVMVSKSLLPRVKEAFILKDVMGSDHCPVGITLA